VARRRRGLIGSTDTVIATRRLPIHHRDPVSGNDVVAEFEARRLTDAIKAGVEAIWELITQAYTYRAWEALGYSSWDDYCTNEFRTSRLRLPREERAEVVASLRESGLSIRAIASATGNSVGTVHGALTSGVQNRTPGPDEPLDVDTDELAEELIASEPPKITGLDGKSYPVQPPQPKPKPSNTFRSRFYRALSDLQRDALSLELLTKKKEFAEHLDAVCQHRDGVVWVEEIITRVLAQMHTDQDDLFPDIEGSGPKPAPPELQLAAVG
jgi:hypothetical protein